jgi:ABC-2 type transport system ATP-binding protein
MKTMNACTPAAGPAIEILHLRKTYGATVAVDDVSFSVAGGEIFGLLGPNGAGKTTTIECALGLRSPDSGLVRVLGLDPGEDSERLRLIVGAQLQAAGLPPLLRVGEILGLYRSFYRQPADVAELVRVLGLAGKLKSFYVSLSGGQKQRLSVALALIGQPKIAMLDEMTTGLDPRARRDTWDLIKGVRDRGATIVLVTHYMEEAERLCDRVALIDRGKVVATGSPVALARRAGGGQRVRFVPSGQFDDALLTDLPEVKDVERDGLHVVVSGSGDLVSAVVLALASARLTAGDVRVESATLEDAFVRLTGRHLHGGGTVSRP